MGPIAEALGWKSETIDCRDLLGTLPGDSDVDSGFDSDSDSPGEPVGDRQLDGQRCIDRLVARLGDIDEPVRLVGSSFGGYVSIMAAERCAVDGLFLMAPALFLEHRFSSTAVRKA
ncbi:MAG: YqiA/YcfP family alpha/beta fold hydrolase [Wenzhouxiangellaceae bacterium]|nr:YqiA/YcfP family alpha/beta fold hydrolase [Wenzhouxiangellaceae bacterium]